AAGATAVSPPTFFAEKRAQETVDPAFGGRRGPRVEDPAATPWATTAAAPPGVRRPGAGSPPTYARVFALSRQRSYVLPGAAGARGSGHGDDHDYQRRWLARGSRRTDYAARSRAFFRQRGWTRSRGSRRPACEGRWCAEL